MNILVTGANGYIGTELCKRLSLQHNVIEIDRKQGISVLDIKSLYGIDAVYHLAAQTSVFNEDKEQIIEDNYRSFVHICDLCAKSNVRMIYASSSCAYNVTSLYGMSKQFNEQYASIYNPNATGIRLHNVWGREGRKGTLYYNLMHGHTIIYGGQQKRHFTYIDDVIEGLILALYIKRDLINISNPEYITVQQFISYLSTVKRLDVEYIPNSRIYDKQEQIIDSNIYTLPIEYTTVSQAISILAKTTIPI